MQELTHTGKAYIGCKMHSILWLSFWLSQREGGREREKGINGMKCHAIKKHEKERKREVVGGRERKSSDSLSLSFLYSFRDSYFISLPLFFLFFASKSNVNEKGKE